MIRTLTALSALIALAACSPVLPQPSPVQPLGPSRPVLFADAQGAGPANPEAQARWEAGQAEYLAWSARRSGWSTTASGLQYRREGLPNLLGDRPGPTDTVEVHYEGTFIDGRVFDSSYERGETIEFPLNRVIAGWTEGLQLMRTGETYHFVIPANLAYGNRWMGTDIPPNSVLLFKVELIDVTPAG